MRDRRAGRADRRRARHSSDIERVARHARRHPPPARGARGLRAVLSEEALQGDPARGQGARRRARRAARPRRHDRRARRASPTRSRSPTAPACGAWSTALRVEQAEANLALAPFVTDERIAGLAERLAELVSAARALAARRGREPAEAPDASDRPASAAGRGAPTPTGATRDEGKARPQARSARRRWSFNAARILRTRLDEMRSFAPGALQAENATEQHDLRIAAKRLRYVLEATGFCFGAPADTARRRARDLQERARRAPRLRRDAAADRRATSRRCAPRTPRRCASAPATPRTSSRRSSPRPAPDRLSRPRAARRRDRGAAAAAVRPLRRALGRARARRDLGAARARDRPRRSPERASAARSPSGPSGPPWRSSAPSGPSARRPSGRARAAAELAEAREAQERAATDAPLDGSPSSRRRAARYSRAGGRCGPQERTARRWRRGLAVAAGAALAGRRAGERRVRARRAPGVGDPFFPRAGNGGYDVGHYDLDLDYRPDTGKLDATATIRATATQDLSAFDLDFRGPRVAAVTVDGAARRLHAPGPGAGGHAGGRDPRRSRVHGRVAYRGRPQRDHRPRRLDRGLGARPTTAPSSSASRRARRPGSRATTTRPTRRPTTSRITVPNGTEAIANGVLQRPLPAASAAARTTWSYAANQPMATYLATATIGQFSIDRTPRRRARLAGRDRPASCRASRAACAARSIARAIIVEFFDGPLRPLPVRLRPGRSSTDAPAGRLRARDPDPPDLRPACRAIRPSPTRSPTSGSATRSASSAGRTSGSTRASRPGPSGAGTRRRAGRRRRRCSPASQAQPPTRTTSGSRRPRRSRAPRSCSRPRSTSAARWRSRRCASGSATRPSSPSCAPGPPSAATATAPRPSSSPSPRRRSGQQLDALFQRYLFKPGKP